MYKNVILSGKKFLNRNILIFSKRLYQSENGVYGNRTKPIAEEYKVPEDILDSRHNNSNVYRWIEAYRKYGHRLAITNPVEFKEKSIYFEELNSKYYRVDKSDNIKTKGLINIPEDSTSITELEKLLKKIYCGSVGAEFSHIDSIAEKEWLSENYENAILNNYISKEQKRNLAKTLIKSQTFENFLATKFPTVKRYSGEGSESTLAFCTELFRLSAKENLQHIVIAFPHRGKNSLLTLLLNVRPLKFFIKYQGGCEFPKNLNAMGDTPMHYNASVDLKIDDNNIRVSLLRNPSHLEAANPISMGKSRSKLQTGKMDVYSDDNNNFPNTILNVQGHGDAAFSGQGINQETLMMTSVPHFDIGGTIHIIINNQLGFTTPGDRGRGTVYCSDLAKSINAPIFHVNGDEPESVISVTKLAFEYQQKFHKDVFIDLNCFRKWGHNELDDPTFTNPLQYLIINERKSVPDKYAEKLINEKIIDYEELEQTKNEYLEYLNKELDKSVKYEPEQPRFEKQWQNIEQAPNAITYWDTGVEYSILSHIGETSVQYPDDFNIHPHLLKTYIKKRLEKLKSGKDIDWATAEALAFGSLMYQGHNVRISGEDVGRGTFSHRHAMLIDQKTNEMFIPLNCLEGGKDGKLEIANSILSEEAVLGFEYGMAIDNPNNLIIWEAQFGDFYNGAQILVDNYIASAETKWLEFNGLVLLLPHGYDGAGSEHSSCRMERFLQLSDSKEQSPDGDNVNLHIINPTTPAQYFHALRRQLIRNFRKPLIVVAPKTLIRLSDATSTHVDFQPGTSFKHIIRDNLIDNSKRVDKIILCSGKHYYNLNAERIKKDITTTAIIRLETLCPFPIHELQEEISKYPNVNKIIWSQEEARNGGAWSFIKPRFEYLIGKQINYCGRAECASVATGTGSIHKREAEEVILNPFKV